jgi:alpha-tubulin suppressor-like RCC1 family protein
LVDGSVAIAVGGRTGCAATSSGVWCWGDNRLGQLGNNSTITETATATPVLGP